MEHLQRFFLELKSLRREEEVDLELPSQGIFLGKKAEDAALREEKILQELETLWEQSVTAPFRPSQPHTPSVQGASLGDAPGTNGERLSLFGDLFHGTQGQLTAADLSRFFERDARRYGKGE